MAGKGTKILASDYNSMQSNVALVLGQGSGDYGYGQSVSSSQVSTNSRITVSQWTNLRSDLLRCIQHQTNSDYTGSIPTPTTALTITSERYDSFKTVSDLIGPGRLTLPTGQSTLETIASTVRTTAWNGLISQTVTLTFPESGIYPGTYGGRYFFNSGGRIQFTASRTGGNTGLKNTSWTTLLQNMGTIYFDYTTTSVVGGTGTFVSNIGFYDLTTSDQVIFEKTLANGELYYPNIYYIKARVNDVTNRNQVIFTIVFNDAATSTGHNPTWAIDENVDGTLTSTVQSYRATGSNVTVVAPSVVASGIA